MQQKDSIELEEQKINRLQLPNIKNPSSLLQQQHLSYQERKSALAEENLYN